MSGRAYNDLYENDEFDDEIAYPGQENYSFAEPIEQFGRKVTATAEHFFGTNPVTSDTYQTAIKGFHKKLKEPKVQRSIYQIARSSQNKLTSGFSFGNIFGSSGSARLLPDIPEPNPNIPEAPYSLFQGYQVTVNDSDSSLDRADRLLTDGRDGRRDRRLLTGPGGQVSDSDPPKVRLQADEAGLKSKLERLRIRKNMAACEIMEIDTKVSNLQTIRTTVVDRLADLEQEEIDLETRLMDVQNEIEDWEDEEEEDGDDDDDDTGVVRLSSDGTKREESDLEVIDMPGVPKKHRSSSHRFPKSHNVESMSSAPSVKKRRRSMKRMSVPILHEHLECGSPIRVIDTGLDGFTALDFDRPFGLMVTASLDDSVLVWDLSLGRRIGSLEGHVSSVRCLHIDDTVVATGSSDATIKLWDLSQADHARGRVAVDGEDPLFGSPRHEDDHHHMTNTLDGCELTTLEAHVAEVTALHVHGSSLVSGSADKTLRQWDLVKGRCIQTLDVIWAAAQSQTTVGGGGGSGGNMSRSGFGFGMGAAFGSGFGGGPAGVAIDSNAPFVGALQFSNYDLASGTADGVVRMWDLRSGQVTQNLVGHTGPVTGLQFDEYYMVTSSMDKSVRIWDLRTGTIFDAFGYDHPIASMSSDSRKIVMAAGEDVIKVFDKVDSSHFDVGAGPTGRGASGKAGPDGSGSGSGSSGKQTGLVAGRGPSVVQRVKLRDSYLVEGREDGVVGVWSC